MKTNRTYQKGFAALALIFALAACAVDLTGPETGEETIPPGMGLASIRLNGGDALTAVPDMSGYYFTLEFTALGKSTVNKTLDPPGTAVITVALVPATWNLEVKGYAESTRETLKVSGNITVPITAGTSASFTVSLSPDFSSAGTGTLNYAITFPSTVSRAMLGLYPIDNTPGTSQEIDISGAGTGTGTLSTLPEGSYRTAIELYDGTTSKAAAWTGVVHIYGGHATNLSRPFTADDFAAVPTVIGEPGAKLAAKLDAVLASVSGAYTIVLDGETDLATFAPKTLNVTGGKNISVTIRGNGETVQVNRTGDPLLTLGADTGSTLSLTLQDLTLTGRSGNSVPVVQVNARGTLVMKAGSRITGNTSSTNGGGVYVYGNNATFTMNGGEVSDNSSSYGGGVYVGSYATFTMNEGKVSGNYGGGVCIGGTFTMNGGEVSGNTASTNGGGVYVDGGTFSMSGGKVSGNSSSSYGGGVYAGSPGGAFTMSGGEVSGNTSSGYGGGVYVYNGTFTMSGGEVHDNILTGTYGREVVVSGTFKMSGDARPQRVFLRDNTRFITISGPVSGGIVPIDLGITGSVPLTGWENMQILKLDTSYSSGNLAALKDYFTLGNSKRTDSSATEEAITGYKIDDGGLFVEE